MSIAGPLDEAFFCSSYPTNQFKSNAMLLLLLSFVFFVQVEEADLVTQAKLIRTKDARVPRLQDLTMRPTISGKTTGSLEAHSNGLRFTSQKHAVRNPSRWKFR